MQIKRYPLIRRIDENDKLEVETRVSTDGVHGDAGTSNGNRMG